MPSIRINPQGLVITCQPRPRLSQCFTVRNDYRVFYRTQPGGKYLACAIRVTLSAPRFGCSAVLFPASNSIMPMKKLEESLDFSAPRRKAWFGASIAPEDMGFRAPNSFPCAKPAWRLDRPSCFPEPQISRYPLQSAISRPSPTRSVRRGWRSMEGPRAPFTRRRPGK